MKRSEINQLMQDSLKVAKEHGFLLPPFAQWSPSQWRTKGMECSNIVRQQLGWDITDFGSGAFQKVGLILFTIRNGVFKDVEKDPMAKSYAEKMLIVDEDQVTPTHFHYSKTEDIINRGGGVLVIQLWNSTEEEGLADSEVEVLIDGVSNRVSAGGTIELTPGESVCLPRGLYHKFWGRPGKGKILVGEVSRVCDEYVDNRFLEGVGRFAEIKEDEEPLYLLFDDYKNYYPYFREAGKA